MEINWAEVEHMCPEDIENLRVKIIKELQVKEDNHQIVKDEYLVKCQAINKLEGEKLILGVLWAIHLSV